MNCSPGRYEPIAREGFIFIVPPLIVSLAFWWHGYPWTSFIFLVGAIAIALFFRNPERVSPDEPGIVISAADGTVMEVVEDAQTGNLPGVALKRVSVFMSVFNVHVNRWPVSGTVRKIVYAPGRFLDAREPASSIENEHNSVILDAEDGPVEVVQIAGKIARRIVWWVNEGDTARRGERFGLIRFGSRVDVYLPQSFSIVVGIGATVRAGVTVIARQTDPEAS